MDGLSVMFVRFLHVLLSRSLFRVVCCILIPERRMASVDVCCWFRLYIYLFMGPWGWGWGWGWGGSSDDVICVSLYHSEGALRSQFAVSRCSSRHRHKTSTPLWDVTASGFLEIYRRFGGGGEYTAFVFKSYE
jgi:hypothetical protein